MAPGFGDLYKPVKDLLTKKYNGDSHKLDIKAKDEVTFNPVITSKGGKTSGTVSVESVFNPCEYANMKLKYEVATAGNFKVKATVDKTMKGLTVEGNADLALASERSKDSYDVKAEYKDKLITASALYALKKGLKSATLTAVTTYQGLNFGVEQFVALEGPRSDSDNKAPESALAIAVSGKVGGANVAATLAKMKDLKVGFTTKVSDMSVGAEYDANIDKLGAGTVTLGCEKKLEEAILKAKITSAGAAAISVQHKLMNQIAMCASVEMDPKKGSKFGTEFTFAA